MAFFEKKEDGYLLRVRLTPNSSLVKIIGVMQNADGEEYLKISVVSVPEKGKANKELLDFLAKKLNMAKSLLEVVGGQTDRWKKIKIKTIEDLNERLEAMLK
ncbi:MAG: DUF167 domain-containing protein [Alphaproteobacteria bacterium]|nr:DUF167 domain-containing protein [Alphaproteobacteria bacterium]